MRRIAIARVLVFGTLLFLLVGYPVGAQQKTVWIWRDIDEKAHTRSELDEILRRHMDWLVSDGKSGSRADLAFADLTGADLNHANLNHANLYHADLTGANLTDANLNDADLTDANLGDANLFGATLTGVHLFGANLNHADLSGANLNSGDLTGANLNSTNLTGANLANADFSEAWLTHCLFEPKPLPELRGVAAANNLESLTYKGNPDALFQLRKQFQDGGFREQERKITYALMRKETDLSWEGCKSRKLLDNKTPRAILWSPESNLANCGSGILNKVFFDWTCQYGMSPGRPLSLGVLLWLLCSALYFACIRAPGKAGLYRVYSQSIKGGSSSQQRAERVLPCVIGQTRGLRRFSQLIRRECLVLRTSMFFSLMSAFNIGFRDINFGRWLRLLTRQEFDVKAVGWARVVAGWQSLISVFLIALWVLTYFGQPFG